MWWSWAATFSYSYCLQLLLDSASCSCFRLCVRSLLHPPSCASLARRVVVLFSFAFFIFEKIPREHLPFSRYGANRDGGLAKQGARIVCGEKLDGERARSTDLSCHATCSGSDG